MAGPHTAAWYDVLDDGRVRCGLCPHHCTLADGARGICLTRQAFDGRLVSLNYCRPVSTATDPIEKKPLYHFLPGASIYSTGPNGCTMKCAFCQNCDISQEVLPTRETTAEDLAGAAVESGTAGVAYTYSEPYIWFETIMEVGALVRDAGLVNVMVTNGFMEPGPLSELLTVVDAMNIDIKSMNPAFYRQLCKADLAPVLRSCEQVKAAGCHLEVTNLLIPGENDSEEDVSALISFVAKHLGRNTPLHISRYFPRHKMRHAATPEPSLSRACEFARAELDFVYLGNISGAADTSCPSCDTTLVGRRGYSVHVSDVLRSRDGGEAYCGACGTAVNFRLQ